MIIYTQLRLKIYITGLQEEPQEEVLIVSEVLDVKTKNILTKYGFIYLNIILHMKT